MPKKKAKPIKLDPTEFTKYFLTKKKMFEPRKDPVWVYLEREMLENIHKKPYNVKVGEWLKFLRDLRYYFYLQRKKERQTLLNELGPLWFVQLSRMQQDVLSKLAPAIHFDLIENLPSRIRKCLSDLGITRSIAKPILIKAMAGSGEDAAVFIWRLYIAIYKKSPSELRGEYDMDARILMSALVFIDLEECLQSLTELAKPAEVAPKPVRKKKQKKYYEPKCRFGEYLQRMHIPICSNHPSPQKGERVDRPPPRMERKITLKSENSYERLRMDDSFLERRMQRCKKLQPVERVCNYKFWEPPIYIRAKNKKMGDYCKKLKLLKLRAKARHNKTGFANMKFNVGPVVLVGGRPRFLLNNVISLPTGYIPINGGTVRFHTGEYLTLIDGFWKYPQDKYEICDLNCNCIEWWPTVCQYLEKSKCRCGHLYDFYHEGKSKEKYFYPPTKHAPMWFDMAKVFQLDPLEDFIKEAVRLALRSRESSPDRTRPELSAGGIKPNALLQALLADLSDTPLVIPHLPQAYLLKSLLEWVRKRFKGKLSEDAHRQSLLQSMRRWLWLKHMDFRKRAYRIPFTPEELERINWEHRPHLQLLFTTLLASFTTRNRLSQLEQTRIWWSTMQFERYPSSAFLDVYFSYMPGRMKDTHVLNPFNSLLTPRNMYKPCPLPKIY